MFEDYRATGFSLKGHPIGFIRSYLAGRKVSAASELKGKRGGLAVSVAGIAIVRQRPGTAKGMVFLTLEDESGIVNLIIRPDVFERYSKVIMNSACVLARGVLEKASDVIYVNTAHIESLDCKVMELEKVALPGRSYSY